MDQDEQADKPVEVDAAPEAAGEGSLLMAAPARIKRSSGSGSVGLAC